jgi:hypothetical protein
LHPHPYMEIFVYLPPVTPSWCHLFIYMNHSWLLTGFVTRVTRRVLLVERELLTLPEHQELITDFSGVRFFRSLIFCVMCCKLLFQCLSFCPFLPLCCLSFFDLRILITPLVFSNSLYYLLTCYRHESRHNSAHLIINHDWLYFFLLQKLVM